MVRLIFSGFLLAAILPILAQVVLAGDNSPAPSSSVVNPTAPTESEKATVERSIGRDEATKNFEFLYGVELRRAKAAPTVSAQIQLAEQLLVAAQREVNQPEFQALLYENACDLALAGGALSVATHAVQQLAAAQPDRALWCASKMVDIRELEYKWTWETIDARAAACEALITAILEWVQVRGKGLADPSAWAAYKRALDLAQSIKSPRTEDIRAQINAHVQAMQLLRKIQDINTLIDKDPINVGLREKLVRLYLEELDQPEEAVKHLDGVEAEDLKKYVPAAAKGVEAAPELACLDLGDWYVTLSDSTPMPSSKAALLTRAAAYYQRFLELHTADDPTRAKATFALKKLRPAENGLAKAKPGDPAGAQNVVAAAIHSYVSAVKATRNDRQSQLTYIQKKKGWLESTKQLNTVLRSNRFIVTYMVDDVFFDPRTKSARIKPKSATIETLGPNVEPVVMMNVLYHVRIACSEDEAMQIRKDSTLTVEGTAALNVDFSADLAQQPALLYPSESDSVDVAELERRCGNDFNRTIYSMKGCWPVGQLPGVRPEIYLVMDSSAVTRIDGVVRRRVFSAYRGSY